MFVQHCTCCYLKGNSNLLYQQRTGFPERFSHSPWIRADLCSAQEFTSCSIPFPLSSHWVCSMPRRHACSTEREAFPSRSLSLSWIPCHCQKGICSGQLWNAFAAKFESWQLTATTPCAGPHGKTETVISQFTYWFDNWFMCFSVFHRA